MCASRQSLSDVSSQAPQGDIDEPPNGGDHVESRTDPTMLRGARRDSQPCSQPSRAFDESGAIFGASPRWAAVLHQIAHSSPENPAKTHLCHLSTDQIGAQNPWSEDDFSHVSVSMMSCYGRLLVPDQRHFHILWINVWTIPEHGYRSGMCNE
jgi:hypothetical protein